MTPRTAVDLDQKLFDVSSISMEDDIRTATRHVATPPRQLNVVQPNVLPAYVEHHPDVDEVGRLTAETVALQYEATAKAVEKMGEDLQHHAKILSAELIRIDEALKYVADTAAGIREEGKASFERVQAQSIITTQVRDACAEIRKKMGAPD